MYPSDNLEVEQPQVSLNLQLGDLLHVLDSVSVVQLVEPVDSDPELLMITQDDDLHAEHTRTRTRDSCGDRQRARSHDAVS